MSRDFKYFDDDLNKMAEEMINAFNRIIPEKIANESVNFFKDRFQEEGWRDHGFLPWRPRKGSRGFVRRNENYRGILQQNGHLRDSIRSPVRSPGMVVISAGNNRVDYAKIHNEGGIINHPGGTPYFIKDGQPVWVRKETADKYRYKYGRSMPVTKPHRIRMPKRKFMGHSYTLDKRIEKNVFDYEMNRIFKK